MGSPALRLSVLVRFTIRSSASLCLLAIRSASVIRLSCSRDSINPCSVGVGWVALGSFSLAITSFSPINFQCVVIDVVAALVAVADGAGAFLVALDEPFKQLLQYCYILAPTNEVPYYIGNLVWWQLYCFHSVDGETVGGAAFNVVQYHFSFSLSCCSSFLLRFASGHRRMPL